MTATLAILDFLLDRWNIIAQAPTVYLSTALVIAVVEGVCIYGVMEKYYRNRIDTVTGENSSLKSQHQSHVESLTSLIDLLKQRLEFMDQQLKENLAKAEKEEGMQSDSIDSQARIRDLDARYQQSYEKVKEAFANLSQKLKENPTIFNFNEKERLTTNGFKALRFINEIDKHKKAEHGFPPLCSVEDLSKGIEIDEGEANSIIKDLKQRGYVSCPFDNLTTFPNLSRPINEEKPVLITQQGEKFLEKFLGIAKERQQRANR